MVSLYMGELLLRQRLSLIPIRGSKDSSHPKAAAIDWKVFQQTPALWPQIVAWITSGYELAIVTGRISGVVVLDFDDEALWQRFSTEKAHLVQGKLVVRTARGFHLYIPVATSGAPISSRSGAGWDLKADGGYVVAPGSVINGHTYTVVSGALEQMPAPTPGHLNEILAWLNPAATPIQQPAPTAHQPILPGIGRDRLEIIQAARSRFRAEAASGRNNALFRTLIWARDRGLSQGDGMALLADFMKAPGNAAETEQARMREFEKTLQSAFSRPARPVRQALARLPDSVRQALAQQKLMHVWRLLDGLYAAGIAAGTIITRRIALALCGERLGQRNVWRALADGRFFARVRGEGSPVPSPNAYGVESEDAYRTDENCKYSRRKKLQLISYSTNPSTKGRPQHLYRVPSLESVQRIVGCQKPNWSSPIQHSSSKEARMALYLAKISHTPGTYANTALAAWFGVHPKTIKNYEKELKIVRTPQYEEYPIASWNTESLPAPKMGHWLSQNGRRYPTVPALAEKLLTKGRVSLVKQRPNFICTADYLQQQKQAALARTRAAVPTIAPQPTIAPKTPQIAPMHDAYVERVVEMNRHAAPPKQPQHDTPLDNGYPDDAMRALKREWRNTTGSDFTVKSDRMELVQAVMPGAPDAMTDHQYTYLLDATPRRILMWLRRRIGDPLYTRDDVKRLHQLMDGMTRKRAAALLSEYGRAKTLRAAEFVAGKDSVKNKPAYLITCLRADKRMSALMKGL